MPTKKPPLRASDASGLVDELLPTDQLLALRLAENDAAKRNKRFSLASLTTYLNGKLGGGVKTVNGVGPDPETGDVTLELATSFGDLGGLPTDNQPLADALAGLVPLENNLVPARYLPSYVDDVLSYPQLSAFPVTGESGKIYIAENTGRQYRWTGSGYALLSDSGLTADQLAGLTGINLSGSNKAVTQNDLKATTVDYDTAKAWQAARNVPTNGLYKITIGSTYLFFTRASEGYFSLLGLRTSLVGNSPLPAFINFTSGNVYPLLSNGTGTKVLSDAGTYVALPDGAGTPSDYQQVKDSIYGRFRGNWAPNTPYKAKDHVIISLPAGPAEVAAKADFISAATYDPSKWDIIDAILTPEQVTSLLARSQPVVGINPDGSSKGYTSLNEATQDVEADYVLLRQNASVASISQTTAVWPLYFSGNGVFIDVADGATVNTNPSRRSSHYLENTNFTFQGGAATGSALIAIPKSSSTSESTCGQWSNVTSTVPVALQAGGFHLMRDCRLGELQGGTYYLYGSTTYSSLTNGAQIIDRRPGAAGGSGGTLATGTYPAQNAGAQAITVAGATGFFDVNLRATSGQAYALSQGTGYTVSGNTLTILAAVGVQGGQVIEYAYLTGSAPVAPGQPSAGGIDYANPVMLSAATSLAAGKSYSVSGTGYPLALPAGANGDGAFVSIAAGAVGLYPIGSVVAAIAGEAAELLYTPNGWIKKSGPKVNIRARIRTPASTASLVRDAFYYLPFSGGLTADSTQSLPGLLDSDGRTIIIPRTGTYTCKVAGCLTELQGGAVYALCLMICRPGETQYTVYDQILTSGEATDVPNLSAPGVFEAGTKLAPAVYTNGSTGRLRNLADSDRFYFFLTEV